jgi:hypothetical protein
VGPQRTAKKFDTNAAEEASREVAKKEKMTPRAPERSEGGEAP